MEEFSPHALAAALKSYFRQLPTPLIPPAVYDEISGVFDYSADEDRRRFIQKHILAAMSDQRREMLGLILRLLKDTAQNLERNKMHSRNLAAVWTPNLIRCESPEEEMTLLRTSQKFIEVLINYAYDLFPEEESD